MKLSFNVILGCTLVALMGCGSSPSAMYPNLSARKLSMTSGALLADCTIIDDMIGDTNKIDLIANKSLGSMILTYFTDRLIGKGYHIDNNILTSVGMLMDRQRVYKLVQSVQMKDTDVEDLPIGLPPFYLNDIFRNDSASGSLWSTYDALIHVSSHEDGSTRFVPSAKGVAKHAEAETLLIILLGGFNVSASKQLNEESASDASTIGRIAIQHISQVTVAFYIVDTRTGELLWFDQRNAQGGTIHKEKILKLADKILDELP
jgi:hypothetical protein